MGSGGGQGLDCAALVGEDRVHRRVYADPAVFELEMERIFGTTWVYVAHESEVAEPGDYKLSRVGRQPVIVARDEDGGLHVMFNRCAHRAASVCQERRGSAQFFRCVYHGWTYANDGRLVGVPWREGYGPDFDPGAFGLTHLPRVASYRGFVFASLAADGPGLDEHLGNALPYLDAFIDVSPVGRISVRGGGHVVGYDANWKLQMENTIDGYHASYLHQTYFKIRKERGQIGVSTGGQTRSRSKALGGGHALLDRRAEVDGAWLAHLRSLPAGARYLAELAPRVGQERAEELLNLVADFGYNLAVFPNLFLFGCTIRRLHPLAVDRSELEAQPALLEGVPDELNAFRVRSHEEFYSPAGFAAPDDWEAFRRVQEGLGVDAVEWLLLSRGLHRESLEPGGVRAADSSDETGMRGQYAHWKALMSQGGA